MKHKPNIVFLDEGAIGCDDLDLSPLHKLGHYHSYFYTEPHQIEERIADAQIVISNKVFLLEKHFAACKRLQMVAVPATGYDNIDIAAARRYGVAVANVPSYATTSVVEHTLMMLLCFAHRFSEYRESAVSGEWQKSKSKCYTIYPYQELSGKTLGIIGFGNIGKKLKSVVQALKMQVLVAQIPGRPKRDTTAKKISIESLLQKSDYVSVNCPLTPLTENLLDAKRLSHLRESAVLLNLARGGIVDERAVAELLKKNRLRGYGADAFSTEPLPRHHVLLQKNLSHKVLLTPHMAWASVEGKLRLRDELCANIRAFLQNKKRNRIC